MTMRLTPIVAAFHDARSRMSNTAIGVLGLSGWRPPRSYVDGGYPDDIAAHDAAYYADTAQSALQFAASHGGEREVLAARILQHLAMVARLLNTPLLSQAEACEAALAMGVATAMHGSLTNAPVFGVAEQALKARQGRSEKTAERNILLADGRWRASAKAKAQQLRIARPSIPASSIATAIMEDDAIKCPSHETAVSAVRRWAQVGEIPARTKK